jgi:hypothetical protein
MPSYYYYMVAAHGRMLREFLKNIGGTGVTPVDRRDAGPTG